MLFFGTACSYGALLVLEHTRYGCLFPIHKICSSDSGQHSSLCALRGKRWLRTPPKWILLMKIDNKVSQLCILTISRTGTLDGPRKKTQPRKKNKALSRRPKVTSAQIVIASIITLTLKMFTKLGHTETPTGNENKKKGEGASLSDD